MHLYLADRMSRLKVDEHTFFRIAHLWAFNKCPDLNRDVLEYRVSGIIPLYVQRYVQHIQKGERDAMQTLP